MKTYRIQLTAEEQKKLEQVLVRLRIKSPQSYFVLKIDSDWISA